MRKVARKPASHQDSKQYYLRGKQQSWTVIAPSRFTISSKVFVLKPTQAKAPADLAM